MPEPSTTPPTPAAPAAPEGVKINVGGKEETVPLEEARRLIGQARVDDQKRARIKEERAQLAREREEQKQALEGYAAMKAYYDKHPEELERAIQIQNGQRPPQPNTSSPFEEPTSSSPTSADPEIRAALRATQEMNERLSQKLEQFEQKNTAKEQAQAVREAISANEFLAARPRAAEHARAEILQIMSQQDVDLETATAIAAQRYQELLNESATLERNKLQRQHEVRPVSPSEGTPPVRIERPATDQPFRDGKRTASGKAGWREARQRAREMGGRIASGPAQ